MHQQDYLKPMAKGKNLKARLQKYKEDMLGIDPAIKTQFESHFPGKYIPPISQEGNKKDFTQSFFHMTPTSSCINDA